MFHFSSGRDFPKAVDAFAIRVVGLWNWNKNSWNQKNRVEEVCIIKSQNSWNLKAKICDGRGGGCEGEAEISLSDTTGGGQTWRPYFLLNTPRPYILNSCLLHWTVTHQSLRSRTVALQECTQFLAACDSLSLESLPVPFILLVPPHFLCPSLKIISSRNP